MLPEFENLIHDLSAEGNFVSEGTFTISLEKARLKFASFAHEDESEWSTLLLQYAVEEGAEELSFTLGQEECLVTALMPSRWKAPDLGHLMTETMGGESYAAQKLFQAFSQMGLALGWEFECELGDHSFVFREGELHGFEEPLPTYRFLVRVPHDPGFWRRGEINRFNAGLLRWLTLKACMCPIRLMVDGRRYDKIQSEQKALLIHYGAVVEGPSPWRAPEQVDLTMILPGGGVVPAGGSQAAVPRQVSALWLLTGQFDYSPKEKSVTVVDAPDSRLHWVDNGVVVESTSISLEASKGLGLEVYASCRGMALSIDGRLIRDEEYKIRRQDLMASVATAIRACPDDFAYQIASAEKPDESAIGGWFRLFRSKLGSGPTEDQLLELKHEFRERYEHTVAWLRRTYSSPVS